MPKRTLPVVLTAIAGIGLGMWDMCGGGLVTVSALLPSEPVNHPMLRGAANAVFLQYQADLARYLPVDAALSGLGLVVGALLIVGGVLILLSRNTVGGVVAAAAFGAGVLVNLLHATWFSVKLWLMWDGLHRLVFAIADAQPGAPPASLGSIVQSSMWSALLLGFAYFLVKVGICVLGLQVSVRRDRQLQRGLATDAEPGFEAPGT